MRKTKTLRKQVDFPCPSDSDDERRLEIEYETSPDAPFNQKSRRFLGSRANQRPKSRENDIEREKQYFHGGKRP